MAILLLSYFVRLLGLRSVRRTNKQNQTANWYRDKMNATDTSNRYRIKQLQNRPGSNGTTDRAVSSSIRKVIKPYFETVSIGTVAESPNRRRE